MVRLGPMVHKVRCRCAVCAVFARQVVCLTAEGYEAYAKPSLKKYKPMAARNEDRKVLRGLL